jgi:hypothetical protein
MSVIIPNFKLSGAPKVKWSSPLTKGLVGYWPLSEGAGTVARDIAGGNHGTLVGGVSQAVGPHGRALGFGGVDGIVNCATNFDITTGLTLSFWMQFRALTTFPRLIGAEGKWILFLNSTKILSFLGSGFNSLFPATPILVESQWYHVAVTYDGAALYPHLGGVRLGGGLAKSGALDALAGVPVTLANRLNGDRPLDGVISNASIHNRALTPSEIKLLYERPLAMIDDSVELWSPAVEAAAPRRANSLSPLAGTLTPLAR